METVILASQSKGRRELLENEGFSLVPLPADIDENIPWVNPEKEIQTLAEKKALACHAQHPGRNSTNRAHPFCCLRRKRQQMPRDDQKVSHPRT